MLVSSRAFGMKIDGKNSMGLIPYADMLNHSYERKQTKYSFDEERNGFVFEALNEIPENIEITNTYGKKCNSRFFIGYGFINSTNEDHNTVPLLSFLDTEEFTFKYKVEAINKPKEPESTSGSGSYDEADKKPEWLQSFNKELEDLTVVEGKSFQVFRVVNNLDDQVMKDFISWLRFAHHSGNPRELNEYADKYLGVESKVISVENETKVWKTVQRLVRESLSRYPTSLE